MSSITGGEKFLVGKNWKRIVQVTRYHQNKLGNPLVAHRNVFCLNLHQFLTLPHGWYYTLRLLSENVIIDAEYVSDRLTDSLLELLELLFELEMLNITILVILQLSLLREIVESVDRGVSSDHTNKYWLHSTDIKSCSIRQSISVIWNLISRWGRGEGVNWSTGKSIDW